MVLTLRLQANIASAVLTEIELECPCSVPKVYKQTNKQTKTLDEI